MADDTTPTEDPLPPDAPDPDTIAEAEGETDPLVDNPPHTRKVSDPTDPIGDRVDATERAN